MKLIHFFIFAIMAAIASAQAEAYPVTCANTASGSAFDCAGETNSIHANPGSVTCSSQTDGCTATECCTVVPASKTCANTASGSAFDCAGETNSIHANPGSVTCSSQTDGCTASECCTVVPSTLTITTTVCSSATEVRMTGPWWNNWDPDGGPVAADNGDGTWTFTFDTVPTANMENLLVVDGVQENLATTDRTCTPIVVTVDDGTIYANREWKVGSENVVNTYGTCGNCGTDPADPPDHPAVGIPRPELAAKWHLQIECIAGLQNCWANGEKQHYTDRPSNVYIGNDGFLHIVARKEEYISEDVTRQYTSARLNSKYDFKYGRIDVRAKLPGKSGLWPAIWTLGSDISEVGVHDFGRSPKVNWPYCGGLDIMEQYGVEQQVGSAMHGPSYPVITNAAGGDAIPWNLDQISVDEFHVYSLDWREDQIRFLVDGVPHKTVTAPLDRTNWPFDHKHFLLLNVAVEPTRAGRIDSDFTKGEMVVDYVHIYDVDGKLQWVDEFNMNPPNLATLEDKYNYQCLKAAAALQASLDKMQELYDDYRTAINADYFSNEGIGRQGLRPPIIENFENIGKTEGNTGQTKGTNTVPWAQEYNKTGAINAGDASEFDEYERLYGHTKDPWALRTKKKALRGRPVKLMSLDEFLKPDVINIPGHSAEQARRYDESKHIMLNAKKVYGEICSAATLSQGPTALSHITADPEAHITAAPEVRSKPGFTINNIYWDGNDLGTAENKLKKLFGCSEWCGGWKTDDNFCDFGNCQGCLKLRTTAKCN